MDFKKITKLKILSIFVAVVVSICFALHDYGVWALVIQYLVFSLLRSVLFWMDSSWKPSLSFSTKSFKEMFDYGYKILISKVISASYTSLQSIFIGKLNYIELGFYTQAKQLQSVPVAALSNIINGVSFPAYAHEQSDRKRLRDMVSKNVQVMVFLNTPLMFFLAAVAKPLFVFLYSERWLGAVEYFQFLCLGLGIFLIIHQCSLSALKAVGRSDVLLKLEVAKTISGLLFVFSGIYFLGIWGMLVGLALNGFLELFLNGYYLKKEIDYGGFDQLLDLSVSLLLSIIVGGLILFFVYLLYGRLSNIFILILSLTLFSITYLLGAKFLKVKALDSYFSVFKNVILKSMLLQKVTSHK